MVVDKVSLLVVKGDVHKQWWPRFGHYSTQCISSAVAVGSNRADSMIAEKDGLVRSIVRRNPELGPGVV